MSISTNTATTAPASLRTALATSLVNGLLSVKPLAKFARQRARKMMMDRAETIGVYWRDEVKALERRSEAQSPDSPVDRSVDSSISSPVNPIWEEGLRAIANPNVQYPPYYTTKFHACDEGNLIYQELPPYVFTLLKSTEPYLDQYFALDMNQAFQAAGFSTPRIVANSPRHRTIIGRKI